MSCSTVTVWAQSGSSGTYWDIGSSSVSFPASTSSRIAVAVNCLDTDAMSNTVSVVILAPDARSAMPRTPDQITFLDSYRGRTTWLVGIDGAVQYVLTAGLDVGRVCGARRCACRVLAGAAAEQQCGGEQSQHASDRGRYSRIHLFNSIFRASPGRKSVRTRLRCSRGSPGSAGRRRQHRGDCRIAHGLPSRNKPIMFRRHRICSAFSSAGNHSVPIPFHPAHAGTTKG